MHVHMKEKLVVYMNQMKKDELKTVPRGKAEPLWGGREGLEADSCMLTPANICASDFNAPMHRQ